MATLLKQKLHLQPSFIEGALRRAVTVHKVDLLQHTLEVNRLLPHDSSMRVDDELILQQIQRAVNLQEINTLRCLLSYLSNPRATMNKCHLQNLAILAAHLGFADAVRLLCLQFPTCLEQTSQGYCLLLALARYSDQQSVDLLAEILHLGAFVNTQEPSGDTAIHVAVKERNVAAVRILLEHNACTQIPNAQNLRPLDVCDDSDILPLIKDSSSSQAHQVSLYIATELGNRESVQHLVNSGVNVDSKWVKGRTALSAAAINGDVETVDMLLEIGASTFPIGSTWPEVPAAHALKHNHYNVAFKLLEKTETLHPKMNDGERKHIHSQLVYLLHYSAQVGALKVATLILNSKYGINANYEFLNTISALHTACRYGQLEIVKLLLEHEVDPNITTEIYFNTPFHYACFYGQVHIARYLLSLPGVWIDRENRQHETPLYCVLRGQLSSHEKGPVRERAVIFLIMRGAKLYKPGRRNCELDHFDLFYAAQRWEFIPYHTQKLMIVLRDVRKPCSLCDLARFAVRAGIEIPLNENVVDATGLSYRMQNFVLLKDWFPTQ